MFVTFLADSIVTTPDNFYRHVIIYNYMVYRCSGIYLQPLGGCTHPLLYEHTHPLAMTPSSPDRLSCMFIDTLLQCNQ